MSDGKKEHREREIFRRFAAISPLGIDLNSITSRPPPEPDILCRTDTGSEIAFELVELIDRDLRQLIQAQMDFQPALNREIRGRFPGGHPPAWDGVKIGVELQEAASGTARMRAVREIVDTVIAAGPTARGKLPMAAQLRKTVKKINVNRRGSDAPWFCVVGCTSIDDRTIPEIEQKFRNNYVTNAPTELLAYYDWGPVLPEDEWESGLKDLVRLELGSSGFRGVWVFDAAEGRILFSRTASPVGGRAMMG